jgi:hypothetical protein
MKGLELSPCHFSAYRPPGLRWQGKIDRYGVDGSYGSERQRRFTWISPDQLTSTILYCPSPRRTSAADYAGLAHDSQEIPAGVDISTFSAALRAKN